MPTFVGRAGSGKDTCARYLAHRFPNARVRWFAGALKDGDQHFFGFSDEQLYGNLKMVVDPHWRITPRVALQLVGTELFRKELPRLLRERFPDMAVELGDNIWLKRLLKDIREDDAAGIITVIADCRFQNESAFVKEQGGVRIRINRPGLVKMEHDSERFIDELEVDVEIENDGTLEELYRKLEIALGLEPASEEFIQGLIALENAPPAQTNTVDGMCWVHSSVNHPRLRCSHLVRGCQRVFGFTDEQVDHSDPNSRGSDERDPFWGFSPRAVLDIVETDLFVKHFPRVLLEQFPEMAREARLDRVNFWVHRLARNGQYTYAAGAGPTDLPMPDPYPEPKSVDELQEDKRKDSLVQLEVILGDNLSNLLLAILMPDGKSYTLSNVPSYPVARVLRELFGNEYASASAIEDRWFRYTGEGLVADFGMTIATCISERIYDLYSVIAAVIAGPKANTLPLRQYYISAIHNFMPSLRDWEFKRKVLNEARILFFSAEAVALLTASRNMASAAKICTAPPAQSAAAPASASSGATSAATSSPPSVINKMQTRIVVLCDEVNDDPDFRLLNTVIDVLASAEHDYTVYRGLRSLNLMKIDADKVRDGQLLYERQLLVLDNHTFPCMWPALKRQGAVAIRLRNTVKSDKAAYTANGTGNEIVNHLTEERVRGHIQHLIKHYKL
jgi:hypothetical protein